MARPKKHITFLDRLFEGAQTDTNCCLIFGGYKNEEGYGSLHKDGNLVKPHREVWALENGEIPPKMCVCHTCDNPSCINIEHLFLGTHRENMEDKARKGRVTNAIGSKNPAAKLKEEDIPVIRSAIKEGETCYSIGRRYKVSGEAILHIKHNRKWKHVS